MKQKQKLVIALTISSLLGTQFYTPSFATSISQADAAAMKKIEAKIGTSAKPNNDDFDRLAEIIGKNPQNPTAHLLLGLCYEKTGLPKQAVQQYQLASNLAPGDPRPLADLATARIRMGDTANISGLVAHALKKFPNDPEIMFLAGYDALQNRKLVEAKRYLSRAYMLKPEIPWLKACYAELTYLLHDYVRAYALAKQELQKDPDNAKANEVAGLCLISLGRYSDAVKYLGYACTAKPERYDLTEKLAILAAWTGRYTDAIAPTLLCLAVTTGGTIKSKNLPGLLLECLRHSNKSKAIAIIDDTSRNFEPATRNPFYHNVVGEALDQVGWHEEAMAQYRRALKIKPDYGMATYNLAHDYELYVHDYQQAMLYYKMAQQLTLPIDISATDSVNRLEDRLILRQQDLAWRLKDLLTRPSQ